MSSLESMPSPRALRTATGDAASRHRNALRDLRESRVFNEPGPTKTVSYRSVYNNTVLPVQPELRLSGRLRLAVLRNSVQRERLLVGRRVQQGRQALLKQVLGGLHHGLGMEPFAHGAVQQDIGDGQQAHSLVVRHETAHDPAARPVARIVHRLEEAV